MSVPPDHRLNVRIGLLDVQTGELLPHSPDWLSSLQIPIDYDPTAECPNIDRLLAQVFPNDALQLAWEVLGDGLTADRSIQKAILLVGEGGNGKDTFLALYSNFVGLGNVSNVSMQDLEENRFAVARLQGKLANVCGDLGANRLPGTAVFKAITGNDRRTAEHILSTDTLNTCGSGEIGRRIGLKIRSLERGVWVQFPPSAPN